MRNHRFYVAQSLAPDQNIELTDDRAHYLKNVLRLKAGTSLVLFNNTGSEFTAEITRQDKKHTHLKVLDEAPKTTESGIHTALGLVISKGERMDYAIQKSTEMGVSVIQPLYSQHCDVRLNPARENNKRKHWQQVAVSASEQSGRVNVPAILAPATLDAWVQQIESPLKIFLDQEQATEFKALVPAKDAAILIGPEGGFSENEKALARDKGFTGITLGPRTLRTETAPVAILSLIQNYW